MKVREVMTKSLTWLTRHAALTMEKIVTCRDEARQESGAVIA
jgi:hypothetical protein